MKFYISGRTAKISEIKEMTEVLTTMGHVVSHDWTEDRDVDLPRPYEENKASQIASKEVRGISDADIFIIIGDSAGTGMYVELGVALATNTKVYSIGAYNDITVFHFLPNVTRFNTFSEVLEDLE